jgi:hypothetical protein
MHATRALRLESQASVRVQIPLACSFIRCQAPEHLGIGYPSGAGPAHSFFAAGSRQAAQQVTPWLACVSTSTVQLSRTRIRAQDLESVA